MSLSPHLVEATRAHGHAEPSCAGLLRRNNLFYSILFDSILFYRRDKGYDAAGGGPRDKEEEEVALVGAQFSSDSKSAGDTDVIESGGSGGCF